MISGGDVCRRLSCSPTMMRHPQVKNHLDAPQRGKNGKREVQMFSDNDNVRSIIAPANKCFYFWAVPPSSWPYLQVAVDTIREMKRRTSGWTSRPTRASAGEGVTGAPGHRIYQGRTAKWIGTLSNAASGRYSTTVFYQPWSVVRDLLIASDYAFTRDTVAETSRHVESFDPDYAEQVRCAADNYALYLRDKRTREVPRG